MRIAVIGAGALGLYYGALLQRLRTRLPPPSSPARRKKSRRPHRATAFFIVVRFVQEPLSIWTMSPFFT
jgi:hypothetical protein